MFGEGVSNPVLNIICRQIEVKALQNEDTLVESTFDKVFVVREGSVSRILNGEVINVIKASGIFGETVAMFGEKSNAMFRANGATKLFGIPPETMENIPVVRWKLLELSRQDTWVDDAAE